MVVTAVVLLWSFVDVSRVFFLGAGLIWLLHGAVARVLRVRGIKAFRARYEASAFASPKSRRLALRIAPPALLFLAACLFWMTSFTQARTYTSEVLVESGFPAQQAGLQNGDRIVSVDGTPVSTFADVSERIRAAPVAAPLSLEVKRGEVLHRLTVHRNEKGQVGIRAASTEETSRTMGSALRGALIATVSGPWVVAQWVFSAAEPEKLMVGVPELREVGGTSMVMAGIGATLSPLWLPFLVLGLALFLLGERAVPPKGAGAEARDAPAGGPAQRQV